MGSDDSYIHSNRLIQCHNVVKNIMPQFNFTSCQFLPEACRMRMMKERLEKSSPGPITMLTGLLFCRYDCL